VIAARWGAAGPAEPCGETAEAGIAAGLWPAAKVGLPPLSDANPQIRDSNKLQVQHAMGGSGLAGKHWKAALELLRSCLLGRTVK